MEYYEWWRDHRDRCGQHRGLPARRRHGNQRLRGDDRGPGGRRRIATIDNGTGGATGSVANAGTITGGIEILGDGAVNNSNLVAASTAGAHGVTN
jgi:hypothetical protein